MNLLWENIFKREQKEKDVGHVLSENYLFKNLSSKELKFVLEQDLVHVRHYRPGETVFRQGEMGVGMYIIFNGKVDIQIEDFNLDQAGTVTFVTSLGAGDFFGEIALVENNSRRTATATATHETSLIGFFKPDLNEIVERKPSAGVKIMTSLAEVLGKRLRETADKVAQLRLEIRKHDHAESN